MTLEKVQRKSKIDEAKIEQKDQRWHTRNRIQLVFGSNDIEKLNTYLYDTHKIITFQEIDFHQAKSKAVEEIIDNSIDEFYRGHVTNIKIELSEDGKTVSVEDNGIGFPVDKIKSVYEEYRTGSKFKDEDTDAKGFLFRTLGQNGVGASATCLTSDEFIATVKHHNSRKQRTVTFLDGAKKIKEDKIKPFSGHSGVKIQLTLSKEVYKDNVINKDLLRKRIIDLSFTNPGLVFYFNGEKIVSKRGISELAVLVNPVTAQSLGEVSAVYEVTTDKGKKAKGRYDVAISLAYSDKSYEKEKFISFVNSTPTYDGGFHHDRVRKIFVNYVKEKLGKQAKKDKIDIVDSDILTGMYFIINIVMPNPRFDSQTKRRLVKDSNLEKAIEELISENVDKFLRKNTVFLELCMERASSRYRSEVLREADKNIKKSSRVKIEKLLDANEKKDRSKCSLFICEGDSAIGGLRGTRDQMTQGGIALKGKPLNVTQSSLKEVMDNKELVDIMGSIGLKLGHKVNFDELRYHKIILLADSDVDGGHINTLLTNFFFTYWKELFEKGCIYIAKAPLFEIQTSSGDEIFAESDEELADIQSDKRIKIKKILRNKGLGEMSKAAWKFLLDKKFYTRINVKDLVESQEILDVCFGKESQLRKDLLLAKRNKVKKD